MEREILKIMQKEFAHLNMVQASKAIEQIAQHFSAFTEWCIIEIAYRETVGFYYMFVDVSQRFNTLDEVYDYYKLNVLK